MNSKRGRGTRLLFFLGGLLVLISAALWDGNAAAQEAQPAAEAQPEVEAQPVVEEALPDEEELLFPNANWTEALHVSTTADNGAFVPVIKASSTGRLMIMYNQETVGGVENPFYSQSNDGGDTWSTPARVHSGETDDNLVAFDFAANTAHAIWRTRTYIEDPPSVEDQIWHAREGQWAGNERNLIVDAGERIFNLKIAASPAGVLHVVWAQADFKLYHSISRNGGTTWDPPQALTTGQNWANEPDIVVDQNDNAHLVWEEQIIDGSSFSYEVRYRKGNVTSNSIDWDSHLVLASSSDPNQPGDPRQPTISTRENDLHVAFSRRLESNEQYPYYIGYSPANGWDNRPTNTSPGNPVEINTNTPFYLVSSVAGCSGGVQLFYHGAIDPNPREQVIGTSYKGNWTSRIIVTEPLDRSINPSIVCTGATVHLAYSVIFNVNENHQIFYLRRSPTVYMPMIRRP